MLNALFNIEGTEVRQFAEPTPKWRGRAARSSSTMITLRREILGFLWSISLVTPVVLLVMFGFMALGGLDPRPFDKGFWVIVIYVWMLALLLYGPVRIVQDRVIKTQKEIIDGYLRQWFVTDKDPSWEFAVNKERDIYVESINKFFADEGVQVSDQELRGLYNTPSANDRASTVLFRRFDNKWYLATIAENCFGWMSSLDQYRQEIHKEFRELVEEAQRVNAEEAERLGAMV